MRSYSGASVWITRACFCSSTTILLPPARNAAPDGDWVPSVGARAAPGEPKVRVVPPIPADASPRPPTLVGIGLMRGSRPGVAGDTTVAGSKRGAVVAGGGVDGGCSSVLKIFCNRLASSAAGRFCAL